MDTAGIRTRIEELYAHGAPPSVAVPIGLQAHLLGHFARDYVAAASILEQEGPQHYLPALQLTGHAVELALKACLASREVPVPHGHDLLDLYDRVEGNGFRLDEAQYAAVVHLQHFYFRDLVAQTKFKSRYPAMSTERLGGAVPSNAMFGSVVASLLQQSAEPGA
ncbi:MAG: HEPN domain-containing protein [Dehalococcoidia bacterium]